MVNLGKEVTTILNYCKKILLNEENHSFSKFLGYKLSERSIETPWVAQIIKEYKIKSILDIGFSLSSLDYLGLLLELKNNYGLSIHAVDIIDPKRVKTRYPIEWLNDIMSINITIGDIRDIRLPKRMFDAVNCISTIEHIGFDKPTINNSKTAFVRKLKPEEVVMSRPENTNKIVIDRLNTALKPDGKLLISVPIGKGGAILLRDSLGYYTAEWEYNNESWNEIILNSKFELIEQHFFKFNENGIWEEVSSLDSLVYQDSTLKKYAQGCGTALMIKK